MTNDQVVSLLHTQVMDHPRNMRRVYPLDQVRRMALSQGGRAKAGKPALMEPIIVTPGAGETTYDSHKHHKLIIVAGHLRVAGNRFLGKDAPRMSAIVRFYANEAELLADMSTENGMRADPGPASWGVHVQALLDEGYELRRISRDSGKSVATLRTLLKLKDLCPTAQELVDSGALQLGAAEELLRIPDGRTQAKVARRVAKAHTPIGQIKLVVDHVLEPHQPSPYANKTSFGKVPKRIDPEELKRSANVAAAPALSGMPAELETGLDDLRAAARFTCVQCPISAEHGQKEPAWHLARAAAGEVCSACNIRLVKGACGACPLPQMLSRVLRQVNGQRRQQPGMITSLVGVNA